MPRAEQTTPPAWLVTLHSAGGTGSGVLIDAKLGLIVTACHLLVDEETGRLNERARVIWAEHEFEADLKVARPDERIDIAFLQVRNPRVFADLMYGTHSIRMQTQPAWGSVRRGAIFQCYGYPGGRYFQAGSRVDTIDDGVECIDVRLESMPSETLEGFSGGGVTRQNVRGETLLGIVIAGDEAMGLLGFKPSWTFQEELQQARKACQRSFLYFFTKPTDSLTKQVKAFFPRFIGAPLLGSAVLGVLVGLLDDSYETADAIWIAMVSFIPACWLFGLFRRYITHVFYSMFFCGISGFVGYYMWHWATCQIDMERDSIILSCPLSDIKYTYYLVGLVFGMFTGIMLFILKHIVNEFLSTSTKKWIGISLAGSCTFLTGYVSFCDIMRCSSPWLDEKYLLFIAVGCAVMSTIGYIADIQTFGLKYSQREDV